MKYVEIETDTFFGMNCRYLDGTIVLSYSKIIGNGITFLEESTYMMTQMMLGVTMVSNIKIFFDTEFSELSRHAQLISLGMISENGDGFYAELNDFRADDLNSWVKENVIAKCLYINRSDLANEVSIRTERDEAEGKIIECCGGKSFILRCLLEWLDQYRNDSIEMWGDCCAYDWVLINDLWGNALDKPPHIYFIPFDLSTLIKIKGYDNNLSREEFIGIKTSNAYDKHNAFFDAVVIKKCYEKIMKDAYVKTGIYREGSINGV